MKYYKSEDSPAYLDQSDGKMFSSADLHDSNSSIFAA